MFPPPRLVDSVVLVWRSDIHPIPGVPGHANSIARNQPRNQQISHQATYVWKQIPSLLCEHHDAYVVCREDFTASLRTAESGHEIPMANSNFSLPYPVLRRENRCDSPVLIYESRVGCDKGCKVNFGVNIAVPHQNWPSTQYSRGIRNSPRRA